ncbi:SH3 domain-containing protein [Aureicoccus marinus]|jgi:tetratricopeptide (TPR) repeat protein|uniref:SH3b domain-containing protein n=1 Tax=Aureicoccus marinus TaxID=754435 RepID=A0A2S7T8T7_9FLAO|nr:SH3 domain-containing protein [Aureicoccus marinus]PQJ16339.1 hypothetical protein BST99_11965 [Aureicoccus marinus]
MKSLICSLYLFLAWPQQVVFEQAAEAYNAEEYKKAIELYESVLEEGQHSAALYFNLGNAHYQLGEVGPSVYYFEKALLLDPEDAEIRNNLNYANNMRIDAIEQVPKSFFGQVRESILGWFHFDQWARIGIVFMLISVMSFLAYQWIAGSTFKRFFFIVALGAVGLSLLTLLISYLDFQQYQSEQPAVIFSQQVSFTSAPNTRGDILFTLHEGTKVNVLEQYDQWAKVELPDGQTGWIISESVRLLKDF